MTNRQHFNKGFDMGLRGKQPRRCQVGPRVTAAFLSGYRMGLIALSAATRGC